MKDISDNKVPLVRMSQDDPLNPSSNDQVDSNNNNLGESNMIKEKVINNPSIEYLYPTTLYLTELDTVVL